MWKAEENTSIPLPKLDVFKPSSCLLWYLKCSTSTFVRGGGLQQQISRYHEHWRRRRPASGAFSPLRATKQHSCICRVNWILLDIIIFCSSTLRQTFIWLIFSFLFIGLYIFHLVCTFKCTRFPAQQNNWVNTDPCQLLTRIAVNWNRSNALDTSASPMTPDPAGNVTWHIRNRHCSQANGGCL